MGQVATVETQERKAEKRQTPGVDRRVARSRRLIIEAFERLLRTRPLESITVSAIAREADVDRKTFYQHFGSIDGLIDELVTQEVDHALDALERVRAERGQPSTENEMAAFFSSVNETMCRDLVLNQGIIEGVPTEQLIERIREPFERGIVERGLLKGSLPDADATWCSSFLFGGLLSVYRSWLLSDRSVPLEEVTKTINRLIMYGIGAS